MNLFYTDEALTDLQRLRTFIADHNPSAAERVAQALLTRISKLCDFPRLGCRVDQAPDPERIRDLLIGDYIVRYLWLEHAVYILRIWHFREERAEFNP